MLSGKLLILRDEVDIVLCSQQYVQCGITVEYLATETY